MDVTAELAPVRPSWPASSTTMVTAAFALAGVVSGSAYVVVPVVGVLMLAIANGWVRLLRLPSPRGTTAALVGAGVLMLVGGFWSRETHVSFLSAAVACALLLEFGHQLGRADGRRRLVESVSSSVFGIAMLASGACFLVLVDPLGRLCSLTVLIAVLASVGADRLTHSRLGPAGAALVAAGLGAGAGLAIWMLAAPADYQHHQLAAAGAGALAALASFALRSCLGALDTVAGFRARWAAGAACVLSVGVVAYGLAWVVAGSVGSLLGRG